MKAFREGKGREGRVKGPSQIPMLKKKRAREREGPKQRIQKTKRKRYNQKDGETIKGRRKAPEERTQKKRRGRTL